MTKVLHHKAFKKVFIHVKRPFSPEHLLISFEIKNLCHLKNATEKARVLRQEIYFKIHKVYSSMHENECKYGCVKENFPQVFKTQPDKAH